jgi:hypothetical protein
MATAGQQRPYRLSDQQLRDLASRLDTHKSDFHASFARAIDHSSINGSGERDQAKRSVKYFEQATDFLRDRVNDRQSETADAENVLRRAALVDGFMMRNQLDSAAQKNWQVLRLDMNDLSHAYGITWRWSAASQDMPYRVDDRQVVQLLNQIGDKANQFDKSLGRLFDRNRIDDPRGREEVHQSVKDFRQATDRLRERVNSRQSNTLDVEEVLRRGVSIDGFMQRYQLSAQAEQNWLSLRGDLDRLARAYNVEWNWSNVGYTASEPGAGFHHRLTGTYQLENTRGDDPRRAAELAAGAATADQRSYQNLLTRLQAPDLMSIERNGNSVTMASTRGPRVTVDADGTDHVERWSPDVTMHTRATLEGERLVVVTTGNRGNAFTVTFDPIQNGQSLEMTRTIDDETLRAPVTVRSFYRRLSDEARWNIEARRDPDNTASWASSDVGVAGGTRLVALLDNTLSMTNARSGDVYTMTIRSPSQYEGAVIQGVVSAVNGPEQATGRVGMTLNLRSIRLRNGSSYQFDGVIDEIRTPDGQAIGVDREGTLDAHDSQSETAVQRGAIGAALGAVIGAVAGGGKGAAIGAVIGAGGGVASVFIDGRGELELRRGTEMTITSGDSRDQARRITGAQR